MLSVWRWFVACLVLGGPLVYGMLAGLGWRSVGPATAAKVACACRYGCIPLYIYTIAIENQ